MCGSAGSVIVLMCGSAGSVVVLMCGSVECGRQGGSTATRAPYKTGIKF